MSTEIQTESVTEIPGRVKGKTPNNYDSHVIQWLTLPGQPKTKVYLSGRGIPLLCQSPSSFPIVTLENYCKWYGLEILHPDGRVESVDPDIISECCDRVNFILTVDHNFHPRLINEVAKLIGGEADWRAIEMAGGRWVSEIMDGELKGFANFNIPPEKASK